MAESEGITSEAFEQAFARGREPKPRAVSVRYHRDLDRIIVQMDSGVELAFAPADAQGLEHANPEALEQVELLGGGTALHFEDLDADFSVEGLLAGRLGSEKWMAARRLAKTA